MLKKLNFEDFGISNIPWLDTKFHFSFANYYNPDNIGFGVLRVVNDDIIAPQNGFDTHPHHDMEIITYILDGKLSHKDSMSNEHTLTRGEVQYMSAGTGIFHSEYNHTDDPLRLLQIWIYPDKKGYNPNYGDYRFSQEDRHNKLLKIVSSQKEDAPIKINQDVNIYVSELTDNKKINFDINQNRQAYLVCAEGSASINSIELNHGDALEVIEENITIEATPYAHFIIFEMAKE